MDPTRPGPQPCSKRADSPDSVVPAAHPQHSLLRALTVPFTVKSDLSLLTLSSCLFVLIL